MPTPLLPDILGAGKASEKLLDVISKGIGQVYSHTLGVNLESRRIKMISAAQVEAEHKQVIEKTEALLEADELAQRAGKRLLVKEIARQGNIERVISLTREKLDEEVSDDPVSVDWAARYFDIIQDVSEIEIQEIWSKVLAGEIKQPGTFSLRTLEVLRNIDTNEARIFAQNICPLVFDGQLIIRIDGNAHLKEYGLKYGQVVQMRDAGLVCEGDQIVKEENNKLLELKHGSQLLTFQTEQKTFQLPLLLLSTAGQELYGLNDSEPNIQYREDVISYMERNNYSLLEK